jgi:hypothetical protein
MLKVLVAYSTSSTHVQTTMDYLTALKRYSEFEVSYVHVTHNASMNFDLNGFNVIFHNYCSRLCFEGYVSESYADALRRFQGLKIISVQDEYNRTNVLKAAIKDLGFHVVLTCVPQDSLSYVYPSEEFPGIEFITVLTGYVSEDFGIGAPQIPLAERPNVIGYRGRDIGGLYGRLGFDKFEIGRRMKQICLERGIPHDIATDEASRIYGTAWFNFVGSCRSMLGSESGSNVFDFDGAIERTYARMAAAGGGKISYEEFLPMVAERDNSINMGQISPRIFECAVMRTPMVLFCGRYSGAIEAGEHYISLEKDFSNVDSVLEKLNDLSSLREMADRAHAHLVASGRFSYRAFCSMLNDIIRRKYPLVAFRRVMPHRSRMVDGSNAHPVLLEYPTARALPKSVFNIKQNTLLSEVYAREIQRLARLLAALTDLRSAELRRLEAACQRAHACLLSPYIGNLNALEAGPLRSWQLSPSSAAAVHPAPRDLARLANSSCPNGSDCNDLSNVDESHIREAEGNSAKFVEEQRGYLDRLNRCIEEVDMTHEASIASVNKQMRDLARLIRESKDVPAYVRFLALQVLWWARFRFQLGRHYRIILKSRSGWRAVGRALVLRSRILQKAVRFIRSQMRSRHGG